MNRSGRLTLWADLANESANLVRDYRNTMIVDADHGKGIDLRIAAVRGQVNALSASHCPIAGAWEAAADFLPIARLFVDHTSPPALRLALVERVEAAAERLGAALNEGERTRADVFG